MNSDFNYKTTVENENSDKAIIVLKRISQKSGKTKLFKFPVENIDSILKLLYTTKNDIDNIESPLFVTAIETPILDTLVGLFLSGISIKDLASQYNYSEKRIKLNLEEKGLILFDV
jgi:hypothetical protein